MKNANTQNALFAAFAGHVSRLIAKGATASDIKRIENYANERACEFAAGAIDPAAVERMTNQKAIMRTAQALQFIASGVAGDACPITSSLVALIALAKQNKVSFADARFACGSSGNNETTNVKGVSRAKLQKLIPHGYASNTIDSMTSRSVGKNGLFTALGVTRKCDGHSFEVTNKNHPFLIAYAARLSSLSEGQLQLIADKLNKNK